MASDEHSGREYMVPKGDRVIEHGQQPPKYVRPPAPPKPVKNSGIGSAKKKS